jgi:hypothetical protein
VKEIFHPREIMKNVDKVLFALIVMTNLECHFGLCVLSAKMRKCIKLNFIYLKDWGNLDF